MPVVATTAVLAITTEVLATTTGDRVIQITCTIHPGRLRPMGTTHMDTTGVIRIHTTAVMPTHTTAVMPTVTLTTGRATLTTMQPLQLCSAAWASSAIITA